MTQVRNEFEQALKNYLNSFSRTELRQKIRKFRALNFRILTYSQIQQALFITLASGTQKTGTGSGWGMSSNYSIFPGGTKFFRVRRYEDGVNPVATVADCWYPPPSITKIGRVNMAGKPVLYTSPVNPIVAATEAGVMDGNPFVLLEFTATKEVRLGWIAHLGDLPNGTYDKEETEKLEMIRDFLVEEFTREVGVGTEHLYMITNVIAEDYFNYPNSSGYCYPSVARKEDSWNVAFYADHAKEKLELTRISHLRFGDPRGQDTVGNHEA